ncbi:MAG: hypothetical protein D6814_12285 [Calditrichaeota bacterium]|nr:MAG: hypothetical protein D6814_12285 [Calditrichota bacterium]
MHRLIKNPGCFWLFPFIFCLCALAPIEASRAQFVIIAPANSCIDSLSMRQLQKLFKGQPLKTCLEMPVQIVEYAPVSDAFYKKLYGLGVYAIGKHWLRLIFSGERVLPPKSFSEPRKLLKFLHEHENAIGFLPEDVYRKNRQNAIKDVVIEGRSHTDSLYVLKAKLKKK